MSGTAWAGISALAKGSIFQDKKPLHHLPKAWPTPIEVEGDKWDGRGIR